VVHHGVTEDTEIAGVVRAALLLNREGAETQRRGERKED
jgi:hypothetical protein